RVEQPLEGALALAEQRQIEGHAADRDQAADGLKDDPGIGDVVARRRGQPPEQADQRASPRQVLVLVEELPENVVVALEQWLAQAKQFNLFDSVVDRKHMLQIVHPAGLGRAPGQQPEVQAAVLALRDERRYGRTK